MRAAVKDQFDPTELCVKDRVRAFDRTNSRYSTAVVQEVIVDNGNYFAKVKFLGSGTRGDAEVTFPVDQLRPYNDNDVELVSGKRKTMATGASAYTSDDSDSDDEEEAQPQPKRTLRRHPADAQVHGSLWPPLVVLQQGQAHFSDKLFFSSTFFSPFSPSFCV